MKYMIITGTSSGLGEAFARLAIEEKRKVFCISRTVNAELKELAELHKTGFWYFEQDLTEVEEIVPIMTEIFSYIDIKSATELVLINNAGTVEPVRPLNECTASEINNHLLVNLVAPFVLTSGFIRESEKFVCKKFVINITSGAASNPYYGWSLYCSSKAGLDMLTRTAALEQTGKEYPVTTVSIAPGVLDTPMQAKVRNANSDDFPMKPKFELLYKENKLTPPLEAAAKILQMINEGSLSSGTIRDLRES